jgi:hypothetical protein
MNGHVAARPLYWLGAWSGLLLVGVLASEPSQSYALAVQPELHASAPASYQNEIVKGVPCAACQLVTPGQPALRGSSTRVADAASGWPRYVPMEPGGSSAWRLHRTATSASTSFLPVA